MPINTDFKPFFITGIVGIVLWNIYCYYKQFESRVGSLIQKAKAPIEKELKVMSQDTLAADCKDITIFCCLVDLHKVYL